MSVMEWRVMKCLYTDWSQGWILEFWGPKQTLRKWPQYIVKCVLFHACNIYILSLKKVPWLLYLLKLCQRRSPYILNLLYRNFVSWKQGKFFVLSGNLPQRESPLYTVNCFKSFDCKLFFAYALQLLRGSLTHLHIAFSLSWKTYGMLQSLLYVALRVIHKLFNKQCTTYCKYETLEVGPAASLKKGEPMPPPHSPPLTCTLIGRFGGDLRRFQLLLLSDVGKS